MILNYIQEALAEGADPNDIYAPEQFLPELVAGYKYYITQRDNIYEYEFKVGDYTVWVESTTLVGID